MLVDHWEKPIVELSSPLSWGRLPLATNPENCLAVPNDFPQSKRTTDIAFIGHDQVGVIPIRSLLLEHVRKLCVARKWIYEIQHSVTREDMQATYLRSKIVFNASLGTALNCRTYEALACGCNLVTDGGNVDADSARSSGAMFYGSLPQIEFFFEWLLGDGHQSTRDDSEQRRDMNARLGTAWAHAHRPELQWNRIIDAAEQAKVLL